jgi:hypothetical protein
VSLFVFLVGVPLLVNRDLSRWEQVCGTLLYTGVALAIGYTAWRAFGAARKNWSLK